MLHDNDREKLEERDKKVSEALEIGVNLLGDGRGGDHTITDVNNRLNRNAIDTLFTNAQLNNPEDKIFALEQLNNYI